MSGRKRTKRKNSDEDFDVDEGDDGLDLDDINTWACHSCTFVNRAAAFRCNVCGTRKGTSTRRSRCNDNVVEQQKSITDMVQKQVEKEKSLKRKERSMIKSVPRDEEDTTAEVKTENPDVTLEGPKLEVMDTSSPVGASEPEATTPITLPFLSVPELIRSVKLETFEKQEEPIRPPSIPKTPKEKVSHEIKKKSPKLSRDSTPSVTTTSTLSITGAELPQLIVVENPMKKEPTPVPITVPPATYVSDLPLPSSSSASQFENSSEVKIEVTPNPQPAITFSSMPSTSTSIPNSQIVITPEMLANLIPETPRLTRPEESLLQQLPERIVKKLNHQLPYDFEVLQAHKRMTGIDPIVADTEAVLLPSDWDKVKVMREVASSMGSHHTISPTTSRQSSETDSSSSDGNRSFETPLSDAHSSVSKCCQIPDYMIHRDAPRKIFIVTNGYPAFFEEFPRRI